MKPVAVGTEFFELDAEQAGSSHEDQLPTAAVGIEPLEPDAEPDGLDGWYDGAISACEKVGQEAVDEAADALDAACAGIISDPQICLHLDH